MPGPGCTRNTGFVLPACPTPATATRTGTERARPALCGWVVAMTIFLHLQLHWLALIGAYSMQVLHSTHEAKELV